MVEKIYVWDPLVRLFHWLLVLSFMISYLTGDDDSQLHIYSGYLLLGLIAFRIVWGFIGTRYARFSNFIHPISHAIDYLKGLADGNCKHYIGHNPAGGLMVLALLTSLSLTGLSGLLVYGAEGHGPLASTTPISSGSTNHIDDDHEDDDDDDHEVENEASEFWEEIHEFFANFSVLLVIMHLVGVFMSSKIHNEDLIKAMITGFKEPKKTQEIFRRE